MSASSSGTPLNRFTIFRYDGPHVDHPEAEVLLPDEDPNETEGTEHMEVNGVGGVGRMLPTSGARPAANVNNVSSSAPSTPVDEVEISSAGKALDNLSRNSSLRAERLAQIKAQIADGTYETPEKLEAALDRMMGKYGLSED